MAVEIQYEASKHRNGGTFERNSGSCNQCHTHQGFIAAVVDGTPISTASQPAPVNCRTCHQIHTTYEGADYALTSTGAVTLMAGGTFDIAALDDTAPIGANLCANCHQGRDDRLDLSGATTTIGSFRAGYHHGTQANVLSGQTAEDLPGFAMPTDGAMDAHVAFGCVGCHMQDPYGAQAGGHTWNMTYQYHGHTEVLNDGSCDNCHSTADDGTFLAFGSVAGTRDSVATALDSLAVLLRAQGVMQAAPSTYAVEAEHDTDLVKAFLNFKLIEEDYSNGVHNPGYAKGVLQATIDYLNTL